MIEKVVDPTTTEAWTALKADAARMSATSLSELFAADSSRVEALTVETAGLCADLSKNLVDEETLDHLMALARATGVAERRDAMFSGERINTSEDRRVLHVALRMEREDSVVVDGRNVVDDVHHVLDSMAEFARSVRSGAWRGATGQRITHVVNVGIGGSYLGPAMAAQALRSSANADLEVRFVANVDGADLERETRDLDPATTLVLVSSKTFTTLETMSNASLLRRWVIDALGESAPAKHFAAISTNTTAAQEFGVVPEAIFGFWDFIGGRYSMDSAIGLSTMLLVGPEGFDELLAGFRSMDSHFRSASLRQNLPILLGLLRVWYVNFLGAQSIGVMPYSSDLGRLPAYLQQLQMESNGKGVNRSGDPVSYDTGPIVWGEPGTDGQHSFYQLLHQGTHLVPLDLIGVLTPMSSNHEGHDLLIANLIAQAEALAFGRSAEALAEAGIPRDQIPFRTFPGNHPSTLLLLDELTPFTLGSLIALYEHEVFVQGVVWGIDSFDQWGVELGKELATTIAREIEDDAPLHDHDPSTAHAIERYRGIRRRWR